MHKHFTKQQKWLSFENYKIKVRKTYSIVKGETKTSLRFNSTSKGWSEASKSFEPPILIEIFPRTYLL